MIKWVNQISDLTKDIKINENQNSNKSKSTIKFDLSQSQLSHQQKQKLLTFLNPPHRGCAGGRIGTRFLRPRGTSPLKGVNPAGTQGYRNGTESFFGLKGRPSVVVDVEIHNQPVLRMRRK